MFLGVRNWLSIMSLKTQLRTPARRAALYRQIQSVEDDSAWQLHRLFDRVDDPKTKAAVFRHLQDEEGHADAFRRLYKTTTGESFTPLQTERIEIEPRTSPVWKFFAHLNAGEYSAAVFFLHLKAAMNGAFASPEVERILDEESRHAVATTQAPAYLDVSSDEYVRYIDQIVRVRTRTAWKTKAQVAINSVVDTLLTATYFFCVPFFALVARRRLARATHVYSNNHRKVI